MFPFCLLLVLYGLEEKKPETESLGGTDAGIEGGTKCGLVFDDD